MAAETGEGDPQEGNGTLNDGKRTAFTQLFYPGRFTVDASHCPIHTYSHTKGDGLYMQGTDQLVRGNKRLSVCAQGHFDTPKAGCVMKDPKRYESLTA